MSRIFMFEPALMEALISPCLRYRYTLRRTWNTRLPVLVWLMLNPSTADAFVDDNTIGRVISFSKLWGYGGAVVVNLYAFRTPYPEDLLVAHHQGVDIEGPDNMRWVHDLVQGRDLIVGWGGNGTTYPSQVGRIMSVTNGALSVKCLGVTKEGEPKHPLYLKGSTQRITYPVQGMLL